MANSRTTAATGQIAAARAAAAGAAAGSAAAGSAAAGGAGTAGPDSGRGPTLLYLVGRIDRVVRHEIEQVVRQRGLSVGQYTTLSVLDRRSGLSNAQLARRALVSPQSMNEVLLALEERGLVQRRAHPEHGRILQTRLTPKGRKLLVACDAEVREVEARMVSGLSTREQAALHKALLESVHALHGGLDGD
jgi:DNA-binding MarR family transcriptional regulator